MRSGGSSHCRRPKNAAALIPYGRKMSAVPIACINWDSREIAVAAGRNLAR